MPQTTRDALVLLIDGTHERCRRREDFIDEDEDRLLRRELDTFPYYVDELANSEVLHRNASARPLKRCMEVQDGRKGQGISSCR